MLQRSSVHFSRLLLLLAFVHLLIITASNYLVQFPFQIFGFHNTWGAFTFPMIFLASDLTVRIFGADLARRIILVAMLPALLVSYLVSVIFVDGRFSGFAGLAEFNLFVARIALASLLAYLCGQMMEIQVFNRLRQLRAWWLAPAASSVFGCAMDTLVFFSVAFYRSPDAFMAAHWPEIALLDYVFKLTISLLFFLPAYKLLLDYLQWRLTRRHTLAN